MKAWQGVTGGLALFLVGCAGPSTAISLLPLNPLPADGVPILEVAKVSTYPLLTHLAKPHWPIVDRLLNRGGNASVNMVVDETGHPRNIEIQSSSAPEFVRPVLIAAAACRFKPGLVGGKPVRTRVQIPFDIGWTSDSHLKGPPDDDESIR